jgi:hypothetical protein
VGKPSCRGRKKIIVLEHHQAKQEVSRLKPKRVLSIKRYRASTLDPAAGTAVAPVQKVRTPWRVAKVSRRTLGFGLNSHRSSLVRRIAAKRTRLRCRVSASVCANSACSSGLRDLVLSGFPPKRFQGLGRKITGLFLFRPPRNPGCFYRKHRPPHWPRQAPGLKTPCGPKSDCGTTPRRSWCASKEVLLAHICTVPSPTPRWVTARPRRPPRGGLGLSSSSRSKTSAPLGRPITTTTRAWGPQTPTPSTKPRCALLSK